MRTLGRLGLWRAFRRVDWAEGWIAGVFLTGAGREDRCKTEAQRTCRREIDLSYLVGAS